MWGRKRLETQPAAQPEPKNLQLIHEPKPAPLTCEGPAEMGREAKQPTGATEDYATSRLGASFRVKGEISGNEDLHIEGTVDKGQPKRHLSLPPVHEKKDFVWRESRRSALAIRRPGTDPEGQRLGRYRQTREFNIAALRFRVCAGGN